MMPSFANPWALGLLPLVPAVLWLWRRRGRAALRYPDVRVVAGLPRGRAVLARRVGFALRLLTLLALVLALAGPRWPDEGTRIPTEGVSVALVLDVSASMAEKDFRWGDATVGRLDGVKNALRLFVAGGAAPDGTALPGRPDDLFALVPFAAYPETACPLTLDHAALLTILGEQQPRTASVEATTNPGDALAWALHVLKSAPTRRRAIVFLTDGESNVPEGLTPRQAGQLAGNLGVPVYAVDASPDPADPDAGDTEKARATLRALAEMTRGEYFRAKDGAALAAAGARIDRLERDRIESFEYRRYHEAFAWFALAALACWTVALVLESTVWRRVP
jgi:Ca-activated chloride channel family protein